MSINNFRSLISKVVVLTLFIVSSLSLKSQSYPSPRVSLQHILSLSGDSTIISVNSGTVISKVCKDNLGVAAFTTTGSNSTSAFWYDQTGKTYTWASTSQEKDLQNLGLPSSRVYNVYNDAGGVYNGLDMLANVCNKNNISQDKMIICLETWQASSTNEVLAPTVYASAVRYCKTKGYTFKYWEISNEPQYAWGSGIEDPLVYAKHVRECYDSIKSVDSEAMVGNQICRKSYYSDQVLSNLSSKTDFIAGHWYGGLCSMDNYGTEDMILGDNYKTLDYISYENKNILSKTGKAVPQIDTEWRLLADATVNGVSYTGEWNPRVGNIVGTLYQATRLIYTLRDNYTYGANCWHIMGTQPGCLIPAGYNSSGVCLDGKTTYMYWLYYYLTHNTGDNVIEFSGKAPSYTSTVSNNVDDGSEGNLTYVGPLTPVMVTKSSDGTKIYITVVNGSTTKSVPFSASVNSFSIASASAVRISSTDINANWYSDDNTGFVSTPTITTSGSNVSCTLPPLSFTIITLSSSSSSATLSAPVLSSPATGSASQPVSLTLAWNSVTNATSYDIQVSTSSTFETNFFYKTGITTLNAAVSGLSSNTKYYWRVLANNSSSTSSWSTVWNFTTVAAAPSAPSLSSPSTGATNQSLTPTLTWAASTNATSYNLQVSTSSSFGTTLVSKTGLTSLTYSLSGLSNSTTYYWRVSATNASGTSSYSSVWNFTTLPAVPSAPALSSPSNSATGQSIAPSLSWATSTNAASYNLQVSTSSDFSSTVVSKTGLTSVTYSLSGLSNSTTYYWRVSATNTTGTSSWSSVWSFTTVAATVAAPSAPSLSSPATGSANQSLTPTLTWAAATNATSYSFQVSTSSSFETTVISKSGLSAVSYTISGLSNGTKYYWRVNASNSGGTSSWSSVWEFTTKAASVSAPSVPTLTSPATGTTNQAIAPTLTWSAATNASGYSVQVSTSSSFSTVLYSGSDLTSLSYSISGLSYNTTYYWRVNAFNSGGTSSWSSVWSFTTLDNTVTKRNQVITLNAGWNIISFNVIPENKNLLDIVQPLIDEGSLVKMQDEKGNFMANTDNGWFNNMDTLDYKKGYSIKVSYTTQLTVSGTPVADTITIPLTTGFNIIAYPKTTSMVAKTGFQSLMDEGSLLKAQDESGNYIVNLSANNWLVRMDSLLPNKGYYVNVKNNSSLNFGTTSSLSVVAQSTNSDTTYFTKSFTGNPYNSMGLIIRNLSNSGLNLSGGDEIAIFDSSKCVGVFTYTNEDVIGVAAGMTDAVTNVVGYTPGNAISIKVWNSKTNTISVPGLSFYSNQSEVFATQGTTVLELKDPESSSNYTKKTVSSYPNPMTTDCKFKFTVDEESDVVIEVYDLNGDKIKQVCNGKYDQGEYEITWDGNKSNGERIKPGMYVYRFTAGDMVITNKILNTK